MGQLALTGQVLGWQGHLAATLHTQELALGGIHFYEESTSEGLVHDAVGERWRVGTAHAAEWSVWW